MVQIFTDPPKDFNFSKKVSRCCIQHQDKILILKNATKEQLFEIPGGKVEENETPKDACLRELLEETSLSLGPNAITKIGILFVRRSDIDFVLYMYQAKLNEPKKIILSHEHTEYKWVSAHEFRAHSFIPGTLEAFSHYQKCLENLQMSKAYVNAHLLPIKNNRILLALRKNTGFCDGYYGLIAGHVEQNESVCTALIRETSEEAGLQLSPEQLKLAHTRHHLKDRNNVSFFFSCTNWNGEFQNQEPHKCGGFTFFPLDNLPHNIVPYVKEVLQLIQKGITYSDSGWR